MAAWCMLGDDQYSCSAKGQLRRAKDATPALSSRDFGHVRHFGYSAKVTRPAGLHVVRPPQGDIRRRLWRVAGWGALATLLVFGVGLALERLWLGPTDQTALAHVAADVQDEFAGAHAQPGDHRAATGAPARPHRRWPGRCRAHARAVRPGRAAADRFSSIARRRFGLRQRRAARRVGGPAVDTARRSTVRPFRGVCRAGLAGAPRRARRAGHRQRRRTSARRRRGHRSDPSARRPGARSGRVADLRVGAGPADAS